MIIIFFTTHGETMKKGETIMKKILALLVVLFTTQAITLNAMDNNDEIVRTSANQLVGLTGNSIKNTSSFDDLNNQIRSNVSQLSSTDRTAVLVNFISGISGDLQTQINQLIVFGSTAAAKTTPFNSTVQAACAQKIANVYNQGSTNPAYTASLQRLIQTFINSNLLSPADKANFQSYLTPAAAVVQPVIAQQPITDEITRVAINAQQVAPQVDTQVAAQQAQQINTQVVPQDQQPATINQPIALQTPQVIAQPIVVNQPTVDTQTQAIAAQPTTVATQMQALDTTITPQTIPVAIPVVAQPVAALADQTQATPAAIQQIQTPIAQTMQPQTTQIPQQLAPTAIAQSTTQPQILGGPATVAPLAQAILSQSTQANQQLGSIPLAPTQVLNGAATINPALQPNTVSPLAQQYQAPTQTLYAPQNNTQAYQYQPYQQYQQNPAAYPAQLPAYQQYQQAAAPQQQVALSVAPQDLLVSIQNINSLPNLTAKIQAAYRLMQDAARSGYSYSPIVQERFSALLRNLFEQTQVVQNSLSTTVQNATRSPLLNPQQQNFVTTTMLPTLVQANINQAVNNNSSITNTADVKTHHNKKRTYSDLAADATQLHKNKKHKENAATTTKKYSKKNKKRKHKNRKKIKNTVTTTAQQ